MKIVKPYDWEFIASRDMNVFLEGVDRYDLTCALWDKDSFFTVPFPSRQMLAQAPVRLVSPGVGHARLSGLQAWGSCVLSIVGSNQELTASGVNLGHSLVTNVLTAPAGVGANEPNPIRYPLPSVGAAASHYPAQVSVAHETVDTTDQLLAQALPFAPPRLLPLATAERCDASEVLLQDCCIGSDDPKWDQLLHESPFTTSPSYVIALQDVYAFMPAGLVLPRGAKIWGDSSIAAFFNDPDVRQYKQMFRANGEAGIVLNHVRTMRHILDDNAMDALPGAPMLVSNVGFRNHAHWVLNSLLPVFWLQDDIRAGRICLLVPELSNYIVDTLRSLGIPRRSVVVVRPGLYRLETLLFPSSLSTHSNNAPPLDVAPMFRQMRDACLAQGYAPGPERLYITRIGSGTQRKIGNEAALIDALKQRGFACVAPHELSFAEEAASFAGARIIVGQLGAGLTNIGFAPPGCRVLEITSHNYTSNNYWFLCHVMGHRFARALFRADTADDLTLADFGFDVPLEQTLAAVDALLALP